MNTVNVSDNFPSEEVETAFRYVSGYTKPKSVADQVEILQQHFSDLGSVDPAWATRRLPRFAEGFFAVPRWQAVAPTYNAAVELVLDLLASQRHGAFFNNRAGQIDADHLRQLSETRDAFKALDVEQPGADIQVLAAQFGLRHRGRSVRRAREKFGPREYGLGAYHVGIMLLTHPERLRDFDDLNVDTPGDEFDDAAADNSFGRTPCFCFEHGKLEFGTHWSDRVYDYNGSASACVLLASTNAPASPSLPEGGLYADEEVAANSYESGYRGPCSLDAQLATLRAALPQLHSCDVAAGLLPLPPGAEGYFAIPRWEAVAETYNKALERMLELLAAARNGRFFNYRRGRLGADVLRQHEGTALALRKIEAQQSGQDVLVIPAQFGLRHAGRSIRRSRELFKSGEFGLGAFQVAAMLLTHPHRLAQNDDLWPDCAGDEYDDANRPERFGRAPRFIFDGGQEEFGTHWINRPEQTDGSISAFLNAELS